jgi:hypothetical protein
VEYALYICETCRDEPSDECGDACATEWPDELAPVHSVYWPTCRCCGGPAHLVTVLVPLDRALATVAD